MRNHSRQRGRNLGPCLTLFAIKTIDLEEKYGLIDAQWTPHAVAELNGQQVKFAKIEGEFVWQHASDPIKKGRSRRPFFLRCKSLFTRAACIKAYGWELGV